MNVASHLDQWLDDVEEGIMTEAPEVAADLFERFLRSDTSVFDRLDDSGGSVVSLHSSLPLPGFRRGR